MSALYPLRRRSPFAPYDPNDPQAGVEDQASMYGPSLGPAGGPPPQQGPPPPPQQGPPSMFTPAPTGPMPDFSRPTPDVAQSRPVDMNAMPKIPEAPSMYQPAPEQPQSIYEKYGVRPPQSRPMPKEPILSAPGTYGHMISAWQAQDESERRRAAAEVEAAQRSQGLEQQAGYYKNLSRLSHEYEVKAPDGPHWQAHDMTSGKVYDLGPVGTTKGGTPYEDWRQQNPGAPLSEWFKIQPAVQSTTIRAEMPKETTESFQQVQVDMKDGRKGVPAGYNSKKNRYQDLAGNDISDQVIGISKPSAGGDARSDKSYDSSVKQLDSLGKPIKERVERLGRLQDTVNQTTPQADALVAPELLTVMAGGQGSGLRMNEAEIARIVGGRTNWEGIKAALNKWQIDPSKGLTITPAQRQQIRALVNTVYQKILDKNAALDEAYGALIGTTDVDEHRQIVSRARSALSAVDLGTAQKSGGGRTAYKYVIEGPNGERKGSNDGKTWTPISQ